MRVDRSEIVGSAAPDELAAKLYAAAAACDLKVAAPAPGALAVSRRYLNGVTLAFAALLIVIGVVFGSLGAGPIVWVAVLFGVALLLFGRKTEAVTLIVSSQNAGTQVAATGTATGRLAEFVDAIYV